MKCPVCKNDDALFATIVAEVTVPFVKGGGANLAGAKLSQADLKQVWASKDIRSPITCVHCAEEFHYIVGDPKPLRRGAPAVAANQLELPVDADEGTDDSEAQEDEDQ